MDYMRFDQQDFSYGAPDTQRGGPEPVLSIFADRPHLRASVSEDGAAAGLRVAASMPLSALCDSAALPLGDLVVVDCPQLDLAHLAALSRLDMRAARCGARLIVSTSVDALDTVFACMDQSNPVLLVDPTRAERLIALGQALCALPSGQVRELSDDDRLMLLRLTEQVGRIAGRIDRLAMGDASGVASQDKASVFGFDHTHREEPAPPGALPPSQRPLRDALPDARLVRRIIRHRQARARFFDADLFADPAWDMLLDLTAARAEQKRVSVTSLCIAASVPPTTALRWIGQMVESGIFVRVCDDSDRRRAFIELSERSAQAMARYFQEIALTVPEPV